MFRKAGIGFAIAIIVGTMFSIGTFMVAFNTALVPATLDTLVAGFISMIIGGVVFAIIWISVITLVIDNATKHGTQL